MYTSKLQKLNSGLDEDDNVIHIVDENGWW